VCVCVCVGVVSWPACLSDGQYQCDSGQCISVDVVCDGRAHCRDQSDQLSCRMFFSYSLSPGGASLSLAVRRQFLLCTSSRVNKMGFLLYGIELLDPQPEFWEALWAPAFRVGSGAVSGGFSCIFDIPDVEFATTLQILFIFQLFHAGAAKSPWSLKNVPR